MGKRQSIEGILQPGWNLGEREEGSAQKGHGNQDQACEGAHVLMRPCQQSGQNSQKGECKAGQKKAYQEKRTDVNGWCDEHGYGEECKGAQ